VFAKEKAEWEAKVRTRQGRRRNRRETFVVEVRGEVVKREAQRGLVEGYGSEPTGRETWFASKRIGSYF
jgi:hypothetical protein